MLHYAILSKMLAFTNRHQYNTSSLSFCDFPHLNYKHTQDRWSVLHNMNSSSERHLTVNENMMGHIMGHFGDSFQAMSCIGTDN